LWQTEYRRRDAFGFPVLKQGEIVMAEKGKRDKGKKEVQKKPALTLMEKRKLKNDKKKEK
jgi:hypothetical protein